MTSNEIKAFFKALNIGLEADAWIDGDHISSIVLEGNQAIYPYKQSFYKYINRERTLNFTIKKQFYFRTDLHILYTRYIKVDANGNEELLNKNFEYDAFIVFNSIAAINMVSRTNPYNPQLWGATI